MMLINHHQCNNNQANLIEKIKLLVLIMMQYLPH